MTSIDTRTVLAIAASADVDPRSVRAEVAYLRGERDRPVRGRAGERIRRELAAHGIAPRQEGEHAA